MKIVAERPKRTWSKKFKCEYCERTIEVDLPDLRRQTFGEDPNDGAAMQRVAFKCLCKRINIIDDNVPEWVRQEVFSRTKREALTAKKKTARTPAKGAASIRKENSLLRRKLARQAKLLESVQKFLTEAIKNTSSEKFKRDVDAGLYDYARGM